MPLRPPFLTLICATGLWGGAAMAAMAADVTLFAASSLKTALDEVVQVFEAQTGMDVAVSYAGSSVLARQIQYGAPADLFVSANVAWMDVLQNEGLLVAGSRADLLGNGLVLVAFGDDTPVDLADPADFAARLGEDYLAMALVDAVPAGIYGKAALQALGLWDSVSGQVAQSDNVRAALALVATGEAPFGVVYATDARAVAPVHVVATFPEESHPPIIYPIAEITGQGGAPTQALRAFLMGDAAGGLFRAHGFTTIEATP